ncbi:MAG: hypothetical protein ACJASX_000398 [Limisphaerales bacterium]|jgi:hypothetical protein
MGLSKAKWRNYPAVLSTVFLGVKHGRTASSEASVEFNLWPAILRWQFDRNELNFVPADQTTTDGFELN